MRAIGPGRNPSALPPGRGSGFDPLQHVVGARRHFEAGLELAVDQFAAAVVQVVIVRVDRQHLLFSAG
jgi:hypothetical protein